MKSDASTLKLKLIRKTYTKKFKEHCIEEARKHGISFVCSYIGINESVLSRWVHNGPDRKPGSGRKVPFPLLEDHVFKWFTSKREQYLPVSITTLKKKALEIASDLNINTEEETQFLASRGWADNFMRRFAITLRRKTHVGSKITQTSLKDAKKFIQDFQDLVKKWDYDLDAIGNMDETPVFYASNQPTTIDIKGKLHYFPMILFFFKEQKKSIFWDQGMKRIDLQQP
jgi:transposase-like protein